MWMLDERMWTSWTFCSFPSALGNAAQKGKSSSPFPAPTCLLSTSILISPIAGACPTSIPATALAAGPIRRQHSATRPHLFISNSAPEFNTTGQTGIGTTHVLSRPFLRFYGTVGIDNYLVNEYCGKGTRMMKDEEEKENR